MSLFHLSQDQVKRALGQGSYEKRDQSRGRNDADKEPHGRGKGRGKGNGKKRIQKQIGRSQGR